MPAVAGLLRPLVLMTVDSRAMAGLSPRSLHCRKICMGRELGLQPDMASGPLNLAENCKGL